jgi:hypothetical protein
MTISIDGLKKRVAKSIEGCFKKLFSYLACSQIVKSSCGSSSLWLHQKIDQKNKLSRKLMVWRTKM